MAKQLDAHIFKGSTSMSQNDASATETLDVGRYWRAILAAKWRIIGFALLMTIVAGLYVMPMPARYVATSSLLIDAEHAKVLSIQEVYGLNSNSKEYLQTQFEVLKSRKIAQRVIEKLNLVNHPLFNPPAQTGPVQWLRELKSDVTHYLRDAMPALANTTETDAINNQNNTATQSYDSKLDRVIRHFSQNLTISPVKNTQVVNISFESESPQLSATIANTVAEVYIENYLQSKLDVTTQATTWLNGSLEGLRQKLTASEQRLSDFYEREKLVNIDGVEGLTTDEIQGLSKQLLTAQNNVKQQKAIYDKIRDKSGDINGLRQLPEVMNNTSVQNVDRELIRARSKVSELSRIYGPKHPKMIAAQAEITSIEQARNNQIATLIDSISADYLAAYRSALTKVSELKQELEDAKARYRHLSTLETQRVSLQREVDINQQLYNSFFTRLKETSELDGFKTPNARLLDEASAPLTATKPKKALLVLAAAFASVIFGIMVAVFSDAFNRGIRSVEDVENTLGQRLLGLIPLQKYRRSKNLPIRRFFEKKHYQFSEAIRTLRTSIMLLRADKPNKVILVTSSVPREGKTTVAINLAFGMGCMGKVLLVEADLRRPELASQFGLPGFHPGLTNIIAGTHSEDECIVTDEVSGIDLLVAGSATSNPQELLSSVSFKKLIALLSQQYDHIILDTAPTQAVSDAMIASSVCDSLIYVVKADSTSDKVIRSGLSRFLQLGRRIDGVVLNKVDLKKATKMGVFSGFYDQYGYQAASYQMPPAEADSLPQTKAG
ncbi:polysaccharide biosynthesis tyrosine autokinase [Neptunicella marina]|uniref:non-specific protein-tyrosine kinase n=2 Tax=Neptunicella marina TaxID=2125989 RepID=A0A8J6J0A3_9ALTE|nr:polysaccharide biosynthesis tyrosine autokinase [Neptunicella marina]